MKEGGTKKALKLTGGNRQSGIMRGCAVIILAEVGGQAGADALDARRSELV